MSLVLVIVFLLGDLHAQESNRPQEKPRPIDPGEGTYPVPYRRPAIADITSALDRVRNYMESVTPTSVTSKTTGQTITQFSTPVADAIVTPNEANFNLFAYEMGVVHAGMLHAAEVTGDARFNAFSARHFQFFADRLPYFRAQENMFHLERANSFHAPLDPRSLDDSGSMCAAYIRARLAKVGPDLQALINTCSHYVAKMQYRLADGTLARQRPQASSLWADDLYMGVPALGEMGRLTGDNAWFDDAVNNVLGMSSRLFNPQLNIYTHGWNANNPDAPQFYWGRANGWAVLTMCDLLDVLPKNHPGYPKVLAQLRATLRGIAQYQSGAGLWHQMLDRNDSYLETSASAIFVYGYAHAINQGWISPTTYGSIALAGWAGLSTRINAQGQVEGTCVATTFASDQVYYTHRPTSVAALHGYGPTLLAGAEMIRLIQNPAFEIQSKLRTFHFVPKGNVIHD